MSDEIVLTKLDDEADRILDAFEERTGLEGEDDGDLRRFDITGHDHELHVVEVLNDIDEAWPDHVGVADPD